MRQTCPRIIRRLSRSATYRTGPLKSPYLFFRSDRMQSLESCSAAARTAELESCCRVSSKQCRSPLPVAAASISLSFSFWRLLCLGISTKLQSELLVHKGWP